MSGHDKEVERLRDGVNCATLLEKLVPGWSLNQRESTKHALKYRRGGGEILIVNHDGRGWWDPLSEAKGDVFDLVQHFDRRLNFGQVRQVLRRFVGIAPSYPRFERSRGGNTRWLSLQERWEARRRLHRGSRTWHYLAAVRALPAGVLSTAAAVDAVREGPYGSGWFAHRDRDGKLTGIEMRGPAYRGFCPNGRKTLFRLPGSRGVITRLAVFEAPIDAMSLAAIERIHADTLYVATGGGIGPATIEALNDLLIELVPQARARMVAATDSDHAGERYACRLQAMAIAAGVPFERYPPPDGYKDWNQFLQGKAGRAGQ